jgi:hypothetical protein
MQERKGRKNRQPPSPLRDESRTPCPFSRGTTLVAACLSHATTSRLEDAQRGSHPPAGCTPTPRRGKSLPCIVAFRSWAAFGGSCPDSGLPPATGSLAGIPTYCSHSTRVASFDVAVSTPMCENSNDVLSLAGDRCQSAARDSVHLHSAESEPLCGCTGARRRMFLAPRPPLHRS